MDVVVVTIPQRNVHDLPAGLFDGADEHTVVVDTGNYYPKQRGGRIQGIQAVRRRASGSRRSWSDPW
jgi:predicted dinucleotide-binding enzyme